tara:strand:- start:80 stop:184 length:105 start_codon:yes stop_codon:yes gene_type:complete
MVSLQVVNNILVVEVEGLLLEIVLQFQLQKVKEV